MGKGDRRSRRGKIWRGSHGKTRPRKPSTPAASPEPEAATPKKKRAPKKAASKKSESAGDEASE